MPGGEAQHEAQTRMARGKRRCCPGDRRRRGCSACPEPSIVAASASRARSTSMVVQSTTRARRRGGGSHPGRYPEGEQPLDQNDGRVDRRARERATGSPDAKAPGEHPAHERRAHDPQRALVGVHDPEDDRAHARGAHGAEDRGQQRDDVAPVGELLADLRPPSRGAMKTVFSRALTGQELAQQRAVDPARPVPEPAEGEDDQPEGQEREQSPSTPASAVGAGIRNESDRSCSALARPDEPARRRR